MRNHFMFEFAWLYSCGAHFAVVFDEFAAQVAPDGLVGFVAHEVINKGDTHECPDPIEGVILAKQGEAHAPRVREKDNIADTHVVLQTGKAKDVGCETGRAEGDHVDHPPLLWGE